MMRKSGYFLIVWLFLGGTCLAQPIELDLYAGNSSLSGGITYRKPLETGYLKLGLSGVYTDDGNTEYQWGAFQLMVGNDSIANGFRAEVGLKGIFGSGEEDHHSGDIGALAFAGGVGYTFPKRLVPIPLEVFGGIAYAPEPLSFMDTETYSEVYAGAGIQIVPNATLRVSYHIYDIEMDEGGREWNLDDNAIRIGVQLRF